MPSRRAYRLNVSPEGGYRWRETGQRATSWMSSAGSKSANLIRPHSVSDTATPGAATEATHTPMIPKQKRKPQRRRSPIPAHTPHGMRGASTSARSCSLATDAYRSGLRSLMETAPKHSTSAGWTLTVDNAVTDADVSVGPTATFTLPDGTKISPKCTARYTLNDTCCHRSGTQQFHRPNEAAQVINLAVDNEIELILAGVLEHRYTLLSDKAFRITLAPPIPKATKAAQVKQQLRRRCVKRQRRKRPLHAKPLPIWPEPRQRRCCRMGVANQRRRRTQLHSP